MKRKCCLIIMFSVLTLSVVGCTNSQNTTSNNQPKITETAIEQDSVEETENTNSLLNYYDCFKPGNIYDFVDPDTGVHYLVLRDTNYHSGRGGITPRLNSDGTIMVDDLNK